MMGVYPFGEGKFEDFEPTFAKLAEVRHYSPSLLNLLTRGR